MNFGPSPADPTQALREALYRIGSRHTCNKGEFLFQQGQPADGVRVLSRGKVALYLCSLDGTTQLPLPTVEAGYVLGLPALFTGKPFNLTAEALEGCEFSFVERERALQLMRDRLDLGLQAASVVAGEVTGVRQRRAESAQPPS